MLQVGGATAGPPPAESPARLLECQPETNVQEGSEKDLIVTSLQPALRGRASFEYKKKKKARERSFVFCEIKGVKVALIQKL